MKLKLQPYGTLVSALRNFSFMPLKLSETPYALPPLTRRMQGKQRKNPGQREEDIYTPHQIPPDCLPPFRAKGEKNSERFRNKRSANIPSAFIAKGIFKRKNRPKVMVAIIFIGIKVLLPSPPKRPARRGYT